MAAGDLLKVTAPRFGDATVTLTGVNGTNPTLYTDSSRAATVANPFTVTSLTSRTAFVLQGSYTLSVTVNGVEGADPRAGTTLAFVAAGQGGQATFDYSGLDYRTGGVWARGGGSITDQTNTVAASGTAQTLPDVTAATVNDVTLTSSCTLTFPTAAAGESFTLVLRQDATGSRLVTWPGTVKWAGGVAPILSTVASKIDVVSFLCVDGTNWLGFLSGLDMR